MFKCCDWHGVNKHNDITVSFYVAPPIVIAYTLAFVSTATVTDNYRTAERGKFSVSDTDNTICISLLWVIVCSTSVVLGLKYGDVLSVNVHVLFSVLKLAVSEPQS